MKFRSDVNGSITGIRFYKASTNTGTHVANLWTSSGTLLATATFTGETASGWQQVHFLEPGAHHRQHGLRGFVPCHTMGHYSDDLNYFGGKGMDSSPLHALADGVSGVNGVVCLRLHQQLPQPDVEHFKLLGGCGVSAMKPLSSRQFLLARYDLKRQRWPRLRSIPTARF